MGKVAFDVADLGVGPPCLRVDSEETLLTVIDERAQLARAAPGVTPVDTSEERAPVRELIQLSVLGEPLVNSLQETMPAEERLEYAIQATAVIWEPLEQMCCVVSDEVTFDSFGMAPWDAGGMYGNDCRCRETFRTMMLQWLIRLLCRPVIRNGLVRTTRMNTEYGLDRLMLTNMDSPRLAVTPGEWYASDMLTPLSRDLRQMDGIPEVMGAIYDCRTEWDFPQFDSTTVDCSAVELNDLTFHWPGFPPEEVPAGGDTCSVAMLSDLIFHRTSFPPHELSAGRDGIYTTACNTVWGFPHIDSAMADCGAVGLIFRHTSFPPGDLSTGRDGDYIWRDLWTGLSVCNRPVTGSPTFGSSHSLEQCCLWLAALPFRWIGSAEVPLCHHIFQLVSRTSHDVGAPFHSHLCRHSLGNVFAEWSKYDSVIFLDSPLCRHPVWADGGSVFAELDMCLYDPGLCVYHQLLAFNPAVHQTMGSQASRETCEGDIRLRVTRLLSPICSGSPRREVRERFENSFCISLSVGYDCYDLFRGYSFPSDVPVGQIQPLTAAVSSTDAGSTATPFIVPPPPDIEQSCKQLHDFLTYRTPESCQSSFWLSLSASSSALTLPRNRAKFSSSSFSLDHYPPLRGNKSPPAGGALLPPPADDCLFPGLDDPNTAGWCEPCPGS